MPDLNFSVEGAETALHAAAPLLLLKVRITNALPEEEIRSIILQCQIQIESPRRRYTPEEQARLRDLFGEPEQWPQTLRSHLWTHVNTNVGPFSGATTIDLHVPCSFDFNVAATKYFHALESGEVPLCLQFSGTIFYESEESGLRIAQVPWSKEVHYRLPVAVWKGVIDEYYPNCAWLTVGRDVFDRLHDYKTRNGIPTWDQALEQLLGSGSGTKEKAASHNEL